MYSVKLQALFNQSSESRGDTGAPHITDLAASLPPDSVLVSCGNPTVEKLVGIVHLFRDVDPKDGGHSHAGSAPPPAPATPPPGEIAASPAAPRTSSNASTSGRAAVAANNSQRNLVALPEGRGQEVLCLGVPADFTLSDFCAFLGAYLQKVRHIRILRKEVGGESSSYMALLRMDAREDADALFLAKNGRPFSSLEPERVCKLGFVKDVQIAGLKDEEIHPVPEANPVAPTGTVELPSCPVCLDRLDEHVTGLVTTLCNHNFHQDCLLKWGDSSCPVCRYCQQPGQASHCTDCGTSRNLWICLICGNVGCGRYEQGHAKEHWRQTDHSYALELESHKIWSYVGDGWVHRLVQSKATGHLVEVPSPHRQSEATAVPVTSCRHSSRLSRASGPCGADAEEEDYEDASGDELDEALRASKMDSIALEYEHLLTSQLDSQREFYTSQLQRLQSEYEHRLQSSEEAMARLQHEVEDFRLLHAELVRERAGLQRKLEAMKEEGAKAGKERDFLKQLSDSLLQNQKEWKDKYEAEKARYVKEGAEKDAKIQDLEEQVRDLMMFFEGQRLVAEHGGELEGASLLPVPEQQRAQGRGGRGGRGGAKKK